MLRHHSEYSAWGAIQALGPVLFCPLLFLPLNIFVLANINVFCCLFYQVNEEEEEEEKKPVLQNSGITSGHKVCGVSSQGGASKGNANNAFTGCHLLQPYL